MTAEPQQRTWQRHLNALRWVVLFAVFLLLVLLPFLYLYQTYKAAHAYDRLDTYEKRVYKVMEAISSPFVSDPAKDLNNLKGTTWSGVLFGLKLSDPLAVANMSASARTVYWPLVLTALIPILVTVLLGRIFCGWICPATLLYELNDNFCTWLKRKGFRTGERHLDFRLKYYVLGVGLVVSAIFGAVLFASLYPPLIIGRGIYYAVVYGAMGGAMVFFVLTLLFDVFVARRGFCRYLCPGGALYSLLGRFRLVRIQRDVKVCNDCAKCNTVCQFGLDPMRDDFGMECNNCTACINVCPTDSLLLQFKAKDQANQGAGHLGRHYQKHHPESAVGDRGEAA